MCVLRAFDGYPEAVPATPRTPTSGGADLPERRRPGVRVTHALGWSGRQSLHGGWSQTPLATCNRAELSQPVRTQTQSSAVGFNLDRTAIYRCSARLARQHSRVVP